MNTISSLINTLTSEEKQEFLNLLKKKNKRSDTKNIQLFKLLEQGSHFKNADIIIYGKASKGAYHALCKRLHDSLIDFVASKSFSNESSEEMLILKFLVASRNFLEQKQYKIGFKTLEKAEQKAKKYGLLSILNEIYNTKIQYAHEYPKTPLSTLINDFNVNKQLLLQEEQFTLLYATIKFELKQNVKKVNEILETNFKKFNISISEHLSYQSLFKLLELITDTANINRDYYAVLSFIENTYRLLNNEKRLVQKQLFYHIQILYYVANSYFRNRNFETSLAYLNLMHTKMLNQNKKYYSRFTPQHTLLKALNHNFYGDAAFAIQLLKDFNSKKFKSQISYVLDIELSLIVFYFQQSQFTNALKTLNNLTNSDQWYTQKVNHIWVIRKNFMELLLFIELEYSDLVESRLKSFKKKHFPYLKSKNELEILSFFNLISQLYYKPETIHDKTFVTTVHSLKTASNLQQEDIFNVSFFAWLKAKIEGNKLYETTLKLLSN